MVIAFFATTRKGEDMPTELGIGELVLYDENKNIVTRGEIPLIEFDDQEVENQHINLMHGKSYFLSCELLSKQWYELLRIIDGKKPLKKGNNRWRTIKKLERRNK